MSKGITAQEILLEDLEKKKAGEEVYNQKKWREKNRKDPKAPTEDLQEFIFDRSQLIHKRVFTAHIIDDTTFGFGILLPKKEDVLDKKGNVVSETQVWKPVVIASNRRGLVVSKKLENEKKISYEAIPFEMVLKWDLYAIDKYLHGDEWTDIKGIDLFANIKKEYEYYCSYRSKEWYDVNPLWDIGTYISQLFSAYPIKEERGLKGTAKTKTMAVSSNICLNATEIMINPSEATLFRVTEELRPTKFIDEAEKLFKITKQGLEADNRVELINSSYTRNGVVPRQEKIGNNFITKWYHVYSPTRIASINGLYNATEDRAITQVHTKAPDTDARGETDVESDRDNPKWQILRNQCYLWALRNWKIVLDEYKNFKIETTLKKRDLQIWKPLLVIAKVIDENLLKRVLNFAEKLSLQKKNDNISEGTLDYKLLEIFNSILVRGEGKTYVNDVYEKYAEKYGADCVPAHKTISTHLDKIGFKELREKDRAGSYYSLSKEVFDEIISPITDDFSSQSSQSSHLALNDNKISDECMTNSDEYPKKDVTNVTQMTNVTMVEQEKIKKPEVIKIK